VEARRTIRILARDRKSLHRQPQEKDETIEELKAKVAELTEYIGDLENHLGEEEGIDRRIMPSLATRMISWRTWMIRRMMRMLDSSRMRRKIPRSLVFRFEIQVLSSIEFTLSHFV
jgi:hypothetical protein